MASQLPPFVVFMLLISMVNVTLFCPKIATQNFFRKSQVMRFQDDPQTSQSVQAANFPKEKKLIQVMYGIAGDAGDTLHEFEVSLKSLLMSSPTDSDLTIHLLLDKAAHNAVGEIFKRTKIASWSMRNQITIQTYNLQSRVDEFTNFVAAKTRRDMNYSIAKHTIANFFGLFAYKVIKPSTGFVLNLDTDVIIMADLEALWKHVDTSCLFQWSTNGGFVLFNLDREDEIWQHVSEFNVTSSKENGHIGDQRLMDMVNISFPEKVAFLPDEWYVTLSRLKKDGHLQEVRPDGVGMMHLNGNQQITESSFIATEELHHTYHNGGWRLAKYYIDMSWPWAKFISESRQEGDGIPIKILHERVSK